MTAQAGNGPCNVSLALARWHFAGDRGCERGVRWTSHELQNCFDLAIRQNIQEWRLAQGHAQCLLERVVKDRVGRLVVKICKHDSVSFGELGRWTAVGKVGRCCKTASSTTPAVILAPRLPVRDPKFPDFADAELVDSVSLFKRCKSARISDACW